MFRGAASALKHRFDPNVEFRDQFFQQTAYMESGAGSSAVSSATLLSSEVDPHGISLLPGLLELAEGGEDASKSE